VKELLSRLALPELDATTFDSSSPEPVVPGGELVLREVVAGLLEHRQVRLTYRHRGSRAKTRVTVEPARLRIAVGLQYLDAHAVPGGEVRTFAVHRLVEARASKKTFTRRPLLERHAFGAVEGPPVEVVVKFDARVAEYISERRWHPSQELDRAKDGSLIFRATVSGEHEFIGWVMSWAPWAELVAPAAWREGVFERAAALLRRHGQVPR
jgi:predicted DNA-binding transcriptional regulator YafY